MKFLIHSYKRNNDRENGVNEPPIIRRLPQGKEYYMEQRKINKLIIRDSLIAIPTLLFTGAWLFVVLNPNIEIYSGANYGLSVFLNLLLPLTIIAIAEIVYALLLIVECIKSQGKTTTEKVFSCIGIWFAVMYLFLGVYIYRLVRLTILKKRLNQSTQTI